MSAAHLRKTGLGLAGALGFLLLAFWFLVTPNNLLTRLFSAQISDPDARVVLGPYPSGDDLRMLKQHGVETVVSLLDPALPYERVLMDREEALAAQYRLRLLSFPMVSFFGRPVGDGYGANGTAAAEAVAHAGGKVYLHCYLGLHRTASVRRLLEARGLPTAPYRVREGEHSGEARLLANARVDFDEGRFREALGWLGQISRPGPDALALLDRIEGRAGNKGKEEAP